MVKRTPKAPSLPAAPIHPDPENAWREASRSKPLETLKEFKPGIYFNIPFSDYGMIPAINRSSLSLAKSSLLHYRYRPHADESPALAFGSLCHHNKLEPEVFKERYVVLPDFHLEEGNVTQKGTRTESKNTTYYKNRVAEFMALHPGKQEVSREWIEAMEGVVKALDHHPIAGPLFKNGYPEVTLVWEDPKTSLLCKARIDWLAIEGKTLPLNRDPKSRKDYKLLYNYISSLLDIKTSQDCTRFYLDEYDYHLQAAFYLEGLYVLCDADKPRPFHFAAVEKSYPHACRCAPASSEALHHGNAEAEFLLYQIQQAKLAKRYPGPKDPEHWTVSPWYKEHYRDLLPTWA